MKLPEYCSFEAKKEFFSNYERINTIDDFKNKVLILKEDEKIIYRGMPEAKWQLFTSAQREYLCEDYKTLGIEYSNFIQSILSNIKESTIITKYLQNIKLSPNDIFYLSLLQHHGAPSPLLDFTKNSETALYFATKDNSRAEKCNNGIENYFSLYFFSKDSVIYREYNLPQASNEAYEKASEIYGINKYRIDNSINWKDLRDLSIAVLDDNESLRYKNGYFTWANLNIIAQEGCFILYNNKEIPIEQYLKKDIIHCFDIHKSLIETIRTHYCKKTKEDLFPTMDRECAEAYNQFKQNLK